MGVALADLGGGHGAGTVSRLGPPVATGHVLVATSPYPNPPCGHLIPSHVLAVTGLTAVATNPWTLPPICSKRYVAACHGLVATGHGLVATSFLSLPQTTQ